MGSETTRSNSFVFSQISGALESGLGTLAGRPESNSHGQTFGSKNATLCPGSDKFHPNPRQICDPKEHICLIFSIISPKSFLFSRSNKKTNEAPAAVTAHHLKMVRVYKRKLGARNYINYSASVLADAVQCVKDGMPLREAAS
uniref:Uncharacterized protein n=1 Tax=Romanomermis culicivorax TaxID=13658 RepID=A0A915KS37_ROMCU